MKEIIGRTIKNLERHNMSGFFAENAEEAIRILDQLIKDGETVGCADSVTLEETGIFSYLRNRNITFYDKHKSGLSSAEKRTIYRKNFSADTFITGTNAITQAGELVNIDGNGSRVAPMIYGPDQVIVVVGKNKICETLEEAKYRVRQVAAPLDAKRLGKQTPCVSLQKCIDCSHEQRICNDFVMIARQFVKGRIKIIIIDDTLGY